MTYELTPELRELYSSLIHIAAELARGACIPDTDSMIRCKTTPRTDWVRVSRGMDGIADRLKFYAIQLREIADKLPRSAHEPGDSHQLAVGTEVTYSPTYASNLPREGWAIDRLPPDPVFVIRHPNGSVIAAAKGELQKKSGVSP